MSSFNDPDVDPSGWEKYYRARAGAPPRPTLVRALDLFEMDGFDPTGKLALDLGCGTGMDTQELLCRGWNVLAIDKEKTAIDWVNLSVPPRWKDNLTGRRAEFETTELPPCWLANGSYSFPFCHPHYFAAFWGRILGALQVGGRVAGQFFGIHDTWAGTPTMTFHTRAEVEALFQGFKFEVFHEREEDGRTALGEAKHWHEFVVVAKRLE